MPQPYRAAVLILKGVHFRTASSSRIEVLETAEEAVVASPSLLASLTSVSGLELEAEVLSPLMVGPLPVLRPALVCILAVEPLGTGL